MRPRALTVSAFGPFPMQEHVDFTHLDAHGLFLISGPTGSGKTSLLDAMCFALYGRVPGARGELTNDHLRSDHAAPATPTRVVFEFEAGGARWRVTRTPEQDRPKQRGSGTTRRPATAELERWAGEQWEPVAAKTGAVTERITRLVGLSADQFRTVVLLPQGRFQEALHASTTERQELLRTLFGTELYRRVTDVLWRRAKDAHGLVAAGRDELARHREAAGTHLGELRRLAPDAALGDPGDLPEPVDDGALLASADQVIEVVEAAARAGRSAAGQAQEALTEARALAARFDEHAVLQAERARLDAADAQVETWRERLVAAERAASAVEVVRSAVAATERASDARDALAAATDGWSGATAAARALGAPVLVAVLGDESMPTPDALVEAVLRAEQAASEVEALSTARRELADAEAALAHAEARCATATSLAGEHRTRLTAVDDELIAARHRAAPHARLAGELERARTVEAQARAAAELALQLDSARQAVAAAGRAATEAEQTLAVARALRDASLAASLAAALRNGAECPVCGSVEHPLPARPPHDVPEASELAWLESQAAVAQRTHGTAVGELALLEARAGELAGVVDVEQATATVAALDAALRSAAAATRQVEALVAEQDALRAEAERCADDERSAALARTESSQQMAVLGQRVAEAGAAITDVVAGCDPVEVLDLANDLRVARSQLDAARVEADRAAAEAQRAAELEHRSLAAVGFGDRAEWARAHLPAAELDELRDAVHHHDEDRSRVSAALAACVAGPALPPVRPDVEAAESAAMLAVARAQALEQHLGDARRLHRLVTDAVRAGEQAARELEGAVARAGAVEAVAAACRGGGGQPGLETWVLAVVLGEVALAANQWLAQLSDGRYQLQLGGPTSARGQAGLELAVLDAHSGAVRPVQTLSGGETFQASLALALGLADVVGAHSGGVSLDALFIDEGFGSLDRDALEQAVAQLEQLRAGGRLIGVISHVETLSERLPTGIQLQRCGVGSTVVQPLRDEPIALGASS